MKGRIQYSLAWNWGGESTCTWNMDLLWMFLFIKRQYGNGELCELQQKHEECSTAQKVDNSYLSLDQTMLLLFFPLLQFINNVVSMKHLNKLCKSGNIPNGNISHSESKLTLNIIISDATVSQIFQFCTNLHEPQNRHCSKSFLFTKMKQNKETK